MKNKIDEILDNLTEKQKDFIAQFDLNYDAGRFIPNQELRLRVTAGINAICARSSYYQYINEFVKMGILLKDEESSKYFISNLGWNLWKKITFMPEGAIPKAAEAEMKSLLYSFSSIKFFNKNETFLKLFIQNFSLAVKKLSNLLKKAKDSQKMLINSLAFVIWNDFTQPELASRTDFYELLNLNEIIPEGNIILICKYFDFKLFKLNEEIWFICQDYKFWQKRYQELMNYFVSQLPPKELIKDPKDFRNDYKSQIKGKKFGIIHEKTIETIAKEICYQKQYYWSKKYKDDITWLYPRLITLLL